MVFIHRDSYISFTYKRCMYTHCLHVRIYLLNTHLPLSVYLFIFINAYMSRYEALIKNIGFQSYELKIRLCQIDAKAIINSGEAQLRNRTKALHKKRKSIKKTTNRYLSPISTTCLPPSRLLLVHPFRK